MNTVRFRTVGTCKQCGGTVEAEISVSRTEEGEREHETALVCRGTCRTDLAEDQLERS